MTKRKKALLTTIPLALVLSVVSFYYLMPGVAFKVLEKIERSNAGLKQHSIKVDASNIEYLKGGKGDNLLLLHGFGGDKDNWTRISRYLTPHFCVIAPDLPGFGESTRDPNANYTIAAQTNRVRAFVQSLELKSFHLAGCSMGGHIAGTYSARYPKNVISLWLIAPGGVASSDPSEWARLLKAGKPDPLIVDSVEGYEQLLDFIFVKRPFIPRPIKYYFAQQAIKYHMFNEKIDEHLRKTMDSSPSLEVLLAQSSIPTLILWGAEDRILRVSGARILESAMPKAKAVIMEDVGHAPMIERPEESAKHFLCLLDIKDR
ncbi:MAG: alpha/beta fold hydrolase [Candidatus Hermodarchaeia archaeon]|jgi:pimeloyl-ACP methyl ester carboxylesterase